MSYWESLTESHEILAWEEGRLQGMQDIQALIYNSDIPHTPAFNKFWWFLHIRPEIVIGVLQTIREQQEVIDEIRGEEE